MRAFFTTCRRLLAGLMGGGLILLPRAADACPVCAASEPGQAGRIAALGIMILFPFAIGFVVVKVLRNADRDRAKESDS